MGYSGKIATRGNGKGSLKIVLDDPGFVNLNTINDCIQSFGEEAVLSHFLSSRATYIQRQMQKAVKEGKDKKAVLDEGIKAALTLPAAFPGRIRKSARKTREELIKELTAAGIDTAEKAVKKFIDLQFREGRK